MLANQRGMTLVEVLVSIVVLILVSSFFLSFFTTYKFSKSNQLDNTNILLLTTNHIEKVREDLLTNNVLPQDIPNVLTISRGIKNYTITTEITQPTIKPEYTNGILYKVKVKTSTDRKSEEVETYVFKK